MKPPLIILLGPTAVGKTDISLEVAQKLKGEIISADSMLIYQDMVIGTAKPSAEEQEKVPHHLIDLIPPDQSFSVADYCREAEACIQAVLQRKRLPLLVGGTALYLKAFTEKYTFPVLEAHPKIRQQLHEEAKELGNAFVHHKLRAVDALSAEKFHPNDLRRVIRALEVYQLTGIPLSRQAKKEKESPYEIITIGLTRDRQELYQRINLRVDQMMEQGLLAEVAHLLQLGYDRDLVAMQGLGYKELAAHLAGAYTLDRAVEILKRNTRHFAKRQLTWFRSNEAIHWFDLSQLTEEQAISAITTYVSEQLNNSPL